MIAMKKEIDFTRDGDRRPRSRFLFPLIAVAAVLAGLISFLALLAKNDFDLARFIGVREAPEETTASQAELSAEAPTAAPFSDPNAVNVLFYCADGNTLSFAELVVFSASENAIRVKPLALNGIYTRDGVSDTPQTLYAAIGISAVREALASRGYPVHKSVGFTDTNFKRVLLLLGDVQIAVPRDVTFRADAISYSLTAGRQVLKPDLLLQYMKHAYTGDDKLSAEGEAFAEILRTHLTAENVEKGESFFSTLVNYAQTDISMFDYLETRDALLRMLQAAPSITVIS